MRGLPPFRAVVLSCLIPFGALRAQQDPPREDCCVQLYNTGVNLGWASSLLNHVIVAGVRDDAARAAAVADLRRAADHVTAARKACSDWNPVWSARPDREAWLRQLGNRLERGGEAGSAAAGMQEAVRETYRWGEELGTGAVGMPVERFALQGPSCDVGYFQLGWLFGYATQTLRLARARRDLGWPSWQATLEDARAYLRLALPALDQYSRSPNHADLSRANPYGRLGRMIQAPTDLVADIERDADSLWTLTQQAIATDCAVLPGRVDAPPAAGYCVLRRPDLYQPTPGSPTCFEFYLADASVADASRMASIGPTGCGATAFAWRQGWRPDPNLGGPYGSWPEGDLAMTTLSRFGRDFYGCLTSPRASQDSAPRPPWQPPPPAPPAAGPAPGVISRNGGLDPTVVAQKVAGYLQNNFTATFESSPVNLEIDPGTGRATVNQRLMFRMSSYNPTIQVRDEVEYDYALQSGTGTVERVAGQASFTGRLKKNGQVTREWSGALPWSAERQPDGSYRFHIENGLGGWYAPIPYLLR